MPYINPDGTECPGGGACTGGCRWQSEPEPTNRWPYVNENEPMLVITVNEHGYDLPPTVLQEVFRAQALMCEPHDAYRTTPSELWPEGYPVPAVNQTCGDIAGGYECSTIVVGHSPEEEAKAKGYYNAENWPNVQGGRPVAHWRSGISTGCDQELFLMPDGHFEWTEP